MGLTVQIEAIYNSAKKGHQKGIVLLENEFDPAFKRHTFTASAFRPW